MAKQSKTLNIGQCRTSALPVVESFKMRNGRMTKTTTQVMDEPRNLTFPNTNGWTLSVAHNIGGPGYSVMAWATLDVTEVFKFGGDKEEAWCSSLYGLTKLTLEVMAARPPRAA